MHYDDCRPSGYRGQRSLESKWGIIKHDVGKFIGMHRQVVSLNKSGTSIADILRMWKELYQVKSTKNTEFAFKHCWLLVKDFPRWTEAWVTKEVTPMKRKSSSSDHESQAGTPKSGLGVDSAGDV